MAATLHSLEQHNYGLRIFCNGCQHSKELDVKALISRLGPDTTVPAIARKARCQQCGHLGGTPQVTVPY